MEAPLSRVEAILQNILGADNVLVPPQSRVEEILLAILNNTEYIHPGDPSRVEEILLAIKDGGSYDKKALSRVEDILIHKLNDEEYTDYSEDDLSRVEKLLIQWIDLHPEVIKELTTSSFPISILANGLPLLDYTIYGNTVQNGTPTPDNPIEPEFVGDRTENLFDPENCEVGLIVPDGSIRTSATQSFCTDFIEIPEGATYATLSQEAVISLSRTNNYLAIARYREDKTLIQRNYEYVSTSNSTTKNILISSDAKYIRASIIASESGANALSVKPMLNWGTEALPYEPYGYKIPISSAGQTKTIYLGQVPTTRRIKKLVLTGEETNMFYDGSYTHIGCIIVLSGKMTTEKSGYSTHFAWQQSAYNSRIDGVAFSGSGNLAYFSFSAETVDEYNLSDINSIKSYFAAQYAAGTPVVVWYVLATPVTGIVNEPLCKIGDYADSVDFSQAGVEIPTLKKPYTTVIDVETSLEPSSMHLKYSEPSDGPAPKTQVLGTKDREIYVTPNNEVYVLRR